MEVPMPAAKFSAEQYDAIYQEIKNGDISIGEKGELPSPKGLGLPGSARRASCQ